MMTTPNNPRRLLTLAAATLACLGLSGCLTMTVKPMPEYDGKIVRGFVKFSYDTEEQMRYSHKSITKENAGYVARGLMKPGPMPPEAEFVAQWRGAEVLIEQYLGGRDSTFPLWDFRVMTVERGDIVDIAAPAAPGGIPPDVQHWYMKRILRIVCKHTDEACLRDPELGDFGDRARVIGDLPPDYVQTGRVVLPPLRVPGLKPKE